MCKGIGKVRPTIRRCDTLGCANPAAYMITYPDDTEWAVAACYEHINNCRVVYAVGKPFGPTEKELYPTKATKQGQMS